MLSAPLDWCQINVQSTLPALLGYVKVSRVSGRVGESFLSPSDQRDRIAAGHDVIEFIADLGESGGEIERPGLQQALARCEAGEAEGSIVAKWDRFAQSPPSPGFVAEQADKRAERVEEAASNPGAPPGLIE